jgi:adenosylcobinamide-phosphate synthase
MKNAGKAQTLVLALALDWLLGEPPARLHPVVWLGNCIALLERHAPRDNPRRELLYGMAMSALTIGAAVLPALVLERLTRRSQAARLLAAALLKTTFAWRTLHTAGASVGAALEAGDQDAARERLGWLVSRDTATLDETLIAAAAIESLAENASDSVTAPLLAYALAGLPGACAYRAANTLDAMIGYRGRYEHLGKAAARLDDLLNLLPARLTALLMVAAAMPAGGDARQALQVLRRDHAATESPNAGYPMAALAGALDVRLEKVGHYCLHAGGRAPTAADLRRAGRVVGLALALGACTLCGIYAMMHRTNKH